MWYDEKNVDFADAYHAAWMLSRGLSIAHTLDRRHFHLFEHLVMKVPQH